ncbi:MAG: biotin/lipoyl-binding protein [Clostridia bacterium]
MNKRGLQLVVLILMFGIMLSGCALLPSEDERLDPPIREAAPPAYRTEKVRRGDIVKTLTLYSSFQPAEETSYRFDVLSGVIMEIYVKKDDRVKEGDLLAILDTGDLNTQIRDMQLSYDAARINFLRAKERYDQKLTSEYAMKIAEIDYQMVKVKYEDLLEIDRKSRINAVEDGVVTYALDIARNPSVTNISLVVKTAKSENLILVGTGFSASSFTPGDEVTIETQENRVSGVVETVEGNRVRFRPDTIDESWKIGTVARVVLDMASARDVLLVPQRAIITYAKTYVKVLEDGVAKEKEIVTGLSDNSYTEVISGLVEGEEVILY